MKMNAGVISLLLAAAGAAALASCSSSTVSTAQPDTASLESAADTAAVTDTAETEDLLASYSAYDFGGAQFRISTVDRYSYEVFSESLNGDICNDAIFNRNKKIEELMNVEIVPIVTDSTNNENGAHIGEVTKTVLAGDDVYDLTAIIVYQAGTLAIKNGFYDWADIPNVDFSQPWWVSKANDAFTINGKEYVAVGDFCVTSLMMTYCTFFNKRLAQNYDVEDLYQVVLDGRWTIDYLDELARTAYVDLNGNGEVDENDQFGYTGDTIINCDVVLPSFGQSIISKDESGTPYVSINTERTVSAVEKLYHLYYENEGTYVATTWMTDLPVFSSGRSMFITTAIGYTFDQFRDMEDEYGILPFPKYDEAQENYLSDARDQYSVLSVPVTATNLEMIGAVTEALNIESYVSVYPTYYETALKQKYVADSDTARMIDILMEGRNYDFSILHGETLCYLPYLVRQLMVAKSKDFTSFYAKSEEKINKALQKVVEEYNQIS